MASTKLIKLNNYYNLIAQDDINESDATERGLLYILPTQTAEDGTEYSLVKYGSGTAGETLATAPYLGGLGSSGGSGGSNYNIEIDSSGSDSGVYLKNTEDNTREKILSLYDIPSGTRSITTGSNTSLGTNIQYSQIFGTGHTAATDSSYNLLSGQGHEVNGGYNIISGRSNKVTNASNYNAVFCGNSGTTRTITGNNNLVAAAGNTTVTGSHDFVVGTGTVTVTGDGNITGGNQGTRDITGNSNFVLISGSTVKILKGAADSIANVVVGKGHTVTGSYNIDIGGTNSTTGNYNIVNGQNSPVDGSYNLVVSNTSKITGDSNLVKTDNLTVAGNHNVAAATVEFNVTDFESKITGHANFISGDFSNSEIAGNYNSIFGGGGNNNITGTSSDTAQHNFICGSYNNISNAENCFAFGKNHTINNFNRAVLFGQGLTATRNNQVIVGSYNNDQKGAFIVANGSSTASSSDPVNNVSVGDPVSVSSFNTSKQYYASNGTTIVRIFNTGNGWTTNSNILKVVGSQFISTAGDWDIYETNKFNALTVYAGGTVEVGHNPIGPMDVVTKHYLEYALLNGEW